MPLNIKQFTILIFLALLLVACGGSAEPTMDVNAVMTSSVGTMVASFFGTQTAMYTPPSPTSTVTQTPFPTPTPYVPPTPFATSTTYYVYFSPTPGSSIVSGTLVTSTVNPSALGAGCNNLAFIRDVTVPGGTVFKPSEDFVKTWKVQNTGTCPWLYQYSLVMISGTDIDAGPTKIQKKVDVGDWSELSVDGSAPKKAGTYSSYWRLADANGIPFGATLVLTFDVAP